MRIASKPYGPVGTDREREMEKPTLRSPLNAESRALAASIEHSAREVIEFYQRLESCGVECKNAMERAQAQLDFVVNLQTAFPVNG